MALENQQIHTINTDKIFLNNRNDKKTDHIVFETNGILGENNVEFANCNVDVKTGFLKAPELRSNELKDADGNTTITLSSSAIDFHSKTINNFSFSSGSISASSVNSANGYASLDAELDALQSNKVSITNHTANKVFVSSSGGGLTTSSISTTDLNKLSNITVTQAVDLDTMESNITTNNSKTGITSGEQTKLGYISVSQAVDLDTMESNIATNNSKTGITSGEQTKLGYISVSSAVDLNIMTTQISNHDDAFIVLSGDIGANTTNISTNYSNIGTNTSNISTNVSNISTNAYKLTGITYSGVSTAGTYDITGGNFGGVSNVYSNGNVQLIGGYDGVSSSGDVVVKQDNIERMRFTSSNIYIRTSDDNKLIIDDNETADVVSMTFESQGYVLFKGVAGGVQPTKYDMILDRGDDFWSAFTNSRDWDCYNDSNKYDRNSTGATMFLQYYSQGDINMCGQGGNVGIGGTPSYPFHIKSQGSSSSTHAHYGIYQSPGSYMDAGQFNRIGIGATNGYYTNTYIAMKCDYGIWTSTLTTSSDRRIKTNIREVPDDLSLKQLRELPCVYYDYIDYQNKGDASTIGFIAQDVREVMPMAVSLKKEFIPNEMRNLVEPVWETITDEKGNEKFKLTINDLDVSGNTSEAQAKYRFFVNNGNNEKKKEIESLDDGKTFIFDKKWDNVFLYGKEVDDFHIIEKDKIFAMAFSATQEIDRIQQQHIIEIANIKEELQREKNKTIYFEDKLINIEKRLSNANL